MKIYNRYTKKIIFECEKETMKETVIEAIKAGADLSKANLSEADLSKANLSRANLCEADLCGASLSKANLSGADLSRTTLCNCKMEKTKISYRGKIVEVNFTEVRDE